MNTIFTSKMEEYYEKFVELQEKLKKSEQQRYMLEMKFNEISDRGRFEQQAYHRKLRARYKQFLEEDKKRQERNERIIRNLERIETRISMISAKTDRINLLRHQYEQFLFRISAQPYQQSTSTIKQPVKLKMDNKSTQAQMDILDNYLKNISTEKCRKSIEDELFDRTLTSNKASSIADDIMNSIFKRPSKRFDTEPSKDNLHIDDSSIKINEKVEPQVEVKDSDIEENQNVENFIEPVESNLKNKLEELKNETIDLKKQVCDADRKDEREDFDEKLIDAEEPPVFCGYDIVNKLIEPQENDDEQIENKTLDTNVLEDVQEKSESEDKEKIESENIEDKLESENIEDKLDVQEEINEKNPQEEINVNKPTENDQHQIELVNTNQYEQQYDENGEAIIQDDTNQFYDEYGQPLLYDEHGQVVQPEYDEQGQIIPQYDENGQLVMLYDHSGQSYYDQQQYDEHFYDEEYVEKPEDVVKDETKEEVEPVIEEIEDLKKTVEEIKVPEEPMAKVMDILDTDTESIHQNVSKVSNDSEFDFS